MGAGAPAEDAAQDAALRAWRQRAQCRTPDEPGGWIATIAKHEALRSIGRRRPDERFEEALADAEEAPESDVLQRLDVRSALTELSPRDRELLFARYWADLTQDEVGLRLGLADGTVKVRLHRLRNRLQQRLSDA